MKWKHGAYGWIDESAVKKFKQAGPTTPEQPEEPDSGERVTFTLLADGCVRLENVSFRQEANGVTRLCGAVFTPNKDYIQLKGCV